LLLEYDDSLIKLLAGKPGKQKARKLGRRGYGNIKDLVNFSFLTSQLSSLPASSLLKESRY
jgi:hypothetical protein